MDESTLRKLIDCLNKQSDALHGRDHFWTTCLIVGCAFEVIFVFHGYLEGKTDWYRARTRGLLSFPEKPPIKWLILEVLGVILVLAGIGGELRVSILAGSLETRLREANGNLVLLLEKKVENASKSSENAAKGARIADEAASSAQEKVKVVAAEADKIDGILGTAVGLINARRVDNISKLADDLRPRFKGRDIQLVSYVGDAEAWEVCNQLVMAAKGAQMIPEDICGKAWFTSPLISPLSVTAASWDEEGEIAKNLLKEGHLGSTGNVGPKLVIFVGVKSPFIIGETVQTRDAERRATVVKKAQRKIAKH